jgi:peptidyl-prolyl cis-trans isomerase SurA
MQRVLAHVFLGLACAAMAATATRTTAANIPLDRIAVIVNDEIITVHELDTRVLLVTKQLARQGTPAPGRDELAKQLLERMITDKVQLQFAKETGVRVDDQQLDRAVARIAESNNMSLQVFRDNLEKEGVTFNVFRDDIRSEMIMQRLREREVENRIAVSEGEVDTYLAEQAKVVTQDEYNLAHILVRVPEQATSEQIESARRRAETALAQIKKGADFRQVAVGFSDAPDALQGGAIGWRALDRLPTIFADVATKLNPGEVSPVLRSPNGFHILKLLERRGGNGPPKIQQTHVRHILIKTSEVVPEAEAKRKLLDLKQRLDNKAADFAELAQANSNDGSAAKGGDLGWVYSGDMVPEFERAMNALKIGEISAPVQTQFGLHIIEVLERREEDVSQDRRRQQARIALRSRKSDESYQEWLRQQRDRAYVEYHLEDR